MSSEAHHMGNHRHSSRLSSLQRSSSSSNSNRASPEKDCRSGDPNSQPSQEASHGPGEPLLPPTTSSSPPPGLASYFRDRQIRFAEEEEEEELAEVAIRTSSAAAKNSSCL